MPVLCIISTIVRSIGKLFQYKCAVKCLAIISNVSSICTIGAIVIKQTAAKSVTAWQLRMESELSVHATTRAIKAGLPTRRKGWIYRMEFEQIRANGTVQSE